MGPKAQKCCPNADGLRPFCTRGILGYPIIYHTFYVIYPMLSQGEFLNAAIDRAPCWT